MTFDHDINTAANVLEFVISNKKTNFAACITRVQKLMHAIVQSEPYQTNRNHAYYLIGVAKEMSEVEYPVSDIEQLIIDFDEPHFIYRFAREVKHANIDKLQNAIIDIGDLQYIARFGCFIDRADTELIETILVEANNAQAAYAYISYSRTPNIDKFKHIFLKSKKPRYLYALAQHINNSDELALIEDMVMAGKSYMYIRLFAKNIRGASLAKAEARLLKSKNLTEIKKFVQQVPGSRKLNQILIIAE